MSLPVGSRLGSYEIVAPLGAGGMGEVYRATDTRLGREIALKVLPADLAQDTDRRARFEREARLLAALSHTGIAHVYGFESAALPDGSSAYFLAMELVPGEDLTERLKHGPIPVDEALEIARQIAEALEEAHEKGIVHRDLKPANVKLTPEGKVKVLDFGLAKALDPGGASSSSASASRLANSPTLTTAGTQIGVILGTAAYMAPEQAAGGTIDRRADVWSFGVVLYEMLTGRRLFEGETVSHVLASVLKDTPDFSALPAETPERIVNLLRRCLRRKPRERLQAIGDARVVIEEVLADPLHGKRGPGDRTAVSPGAALGSRLAWIVGAAGLAAGALFGALWLGSGGRSASPLRVLHAALVAPDGMAFGDDFALSPDGARIVFAAYDQKTGTRALWLRALDRSEAARLAGTDGGETPFWSPDGAHVGFFAEGRLKRLDLQGGSVQALCDAPTPRGGAWASDGTIVFAPAFRSGLSLVSAGGGAPKALTTLDAARHEKSHRFPVFLPGGKTILFLAQTAEGGTPNDESAIEALEISSGKRTRLITTNSSPLYSSDGRILFWRDGALLAVRFDTNRLAVTGDPVPIASPVAYTQNEQALASVSGAGTLVYREGTRGTLSSLIAIDRNGAGVQTIRDHELFVDLALSHDGKRLAFSVNSTGQGSTDLWIQDLVRGTASRLTFEDGNENNPVWSRDDRFLYYSNDRKNDGAIFRRSSDGTGSAEELGTTDAGIWPMAASKDDRWLVVCAVGAQSSRDLFRYDLVTDLVTKEQITPLVATPFSDDMAALSPDDGLLAYASEQSGRSEVYVQALGGGRGKWQISSEGGLRPRWRADGRELFFFARPDRVMSVTVEAGDVPRFSAPRELFRHPIETFDVSPDGQHVIARRLADGNLNQPLTVIANWTQLLPK